MLGFKITNRGTRQVAQSYGPNGADLPEPVSYTPGRGYVVGDTRVDQAEADRSNAARYWANHAEWLSRNEEVPTRMSDLVTEMIENGKLRLKLASAGKRPSEEDIRHLSVIRQMAGLMGANVNPWRTSGSEHDLPVLEAEVTGVDRDIAGDVLTAAFEEARPPAVQRVSVGEGALTVPETSSPHADDYSSFGDWQLGHQWISRACTPRRVVRTGVPQTRHGRPVRP